MSKASLAPQRNGRTAPSAPNGNGQPSVSSARSDDPSAKTPYPPPFLPVPPPAEWNVDGYEVRSVERSHAAYTQLCWKLQVLDLTLGGLESGDAPADHVEAVRNFLEDIRELAPWFGEDEMTARLGSRAAGQAG